MVEEQKQSNRSCHHEAEWQKEINKFMALSTQCVYCRFTALKKIKNTTTRTILSSFTETVKLHTFRYLIANYLCLEKLLFSTFYQGKVQRELANCVLKDMTHLVLT